MYKGMFTINFSDDELYYFSLLNQDLTVLLKSEKYETYTECLDVIHQIIEIGKIKSSYFKKVIDTNLYYFIMISPFGNSVAHSLYFVNIEDFNICINEVIELSCNSVILEIFD